MDVVDFRVPPALPRLRLSLRRLYQPYRRCFDEWTIVGGADYSPYSQTGVGIWDIARLESGKVLIVFDMERFTPLAFDLRYTELNL